MSECPICDILLDSASTLSKHNLDYHGIAEIKETFKCTVCLEEFEAEDTLFMHFKAKHVSREVKTTKENEAINSEEPFFDFIEEEVEQECKKISEVNEVGKDTDEVMEVTKELMEVPIEANKDIAEVMEVTKEDEQVPTEVIEEPDEQEVRSDMAEVVEVTKEVMEVPTEANNDIAEVMEVTKEVEEVPTEVIEIEGEAIKEEPDEQEEEIENEHFEEFLDVKLEPEIEIEVEPSVTLEPEEWNPSTNEYACQYCPNFSAQTKSELHFHLMFVHLQVKLDCQICSKSCQDLKGLKHHMVNDHGQHDHEFECHICFRRYEKSSRFKDHMIESHSKIDWYCDICGVAKKSRGAIWHHKKIDHQMDFSNVRSKGYKTLKNPKKQKNEHPCNICKKVFKKKMNLKIHLKKHKKSKTIKLTKPNHATNSYAGKKQSKAKIDQVKRNIFHTDENVQVDVETISDDDQSGQADQEDLNKPKIIKLNKPKVIKLIKPKTETIDDDQNIRKKAFECKVCNKRFSMESKLHLHIKSKHATIIEVPKIKTEPQDFQDTCILCDAQVDDLETHYIVHHLKIKLQCRIDNCHEDFSSFWPMEYHMKDKHGFQRHYCTLCYHAFDKPKSLRNHLLGSHLYLKTCDKCDQFFYRDQDLIAHQKTTHANAIQSMIENKENQVDPAKCQLCPKAFKTKKEKINHYLMVHLNMNLDCKLCDLKFDDFVTSRRHQDQKHMIKPACQLCNKKFPRTHRLLEHLMHEHLGIKYTCQICGKQFSRQDYYEVHVGMHQKNDSAVAKQSKNNDPILID